MTTSQPLQTKIIDKINAALQTEKEKTFYSFEYFPPRTEQGKFYFKVPKTLYYYLN